MRDEINGLYANTHLTCSGGGKAAIKLLSEKEILDILSHIADSKFNPKKEIEPTLFRHTFETLNKAVTKVYGNLEFDHPDYDFAQELRRNNAVFAAFKTHREQNDLHKLLTDNKGNLRSFTEFKKASEPVIGDYNVNWLKTEYSTAVMRARVAQQLRQAESEKHLYPNLQWLPSTAPNPREAHRPFYWMIRSQEDPFWQKNLPGSVWNCQCGLKSTAEPVNNVGPQDGNVSVVSMPGLDNNPTDGALFSQSHPYFTEQYGGAKKACEALILRGDSKGINHRYVEEDFPKGYRSGGRLYIFEKYRDDFKNKVLSKNEIEVYLKNRNMSRLLAKWGDVVRMHPKSDDKDLRDIFFVGAKENKIPDTSVGHANIAEYFELKQSDACSKTSVHNSIRGAGDQADNVVIFFTKEIDRKELLSALKGQLNQKPNVDKVWLLLGKDVPTKKTTRGEIMKWPQNDDTLLR